MQELETDEEAGEWGVQTKDDAKRNGNWFTRREMPGHWFLKVVWTPFRYENSSGALLVRVDNICGSLTKNKAISKI